MNAARIFGTAAIVICLLLCVSIAGIAAPEQQNVTANEKLAEQVAQLQTRVLELEQRVNDLQTQRRILQLDGTLQPSSPLAVFRDQTEQVPRGAVEREINGMRYYIMPLSAGSSTDQHDSGR